MRIVCAGGGPAGLYFAVLAKLADPRHEVTVVERNPPGVTYGWGVVFWDDLLDDLFRHDPVSARRIWDAACRWDEYEVRAAGKPTTHLGGYGFSLGRRALLDILGRRGRGLGVGIRYCAELTHPAALGGAAGNLFKDKIGFASGRHPVHTWRVITDPDAYADLLRGNGLTPDPTHLTGRFPAYP